MTKKKTDAQFKKQVHDLVGDEYTFINSYVNAITKLKVKHNKCGNVYEVKPNDFLNGRRCPHCAKSSQRNKLIKDNNQFKQEIKNIVGDEYTFLEPYAKSSVKLKVKHNKCGHIYKVTPNSFLSHHNRCPYCSTTFNFKKTNEKFQQEVYDLVGDEYTFLDSYVNAISKLRVKHNKCGHTYEVMPSNFLRGKRCPYCAKCIRYAKLTKTNTQFQHEVHDLVGDEYVFLDSYVNAQTKLRVKHNKCGHIYEVTPHNFMTGYRCPYCNSPKGETLITKILNILNINYEYQKTFGDLRDNHLLSYDFYIPDKNILIEYQGIQHYESVDIFGGGEQFKLQQKHDKMKSDYAKAHHYNLIAIPYTEDTFAKIKKYLIKHGLTK